ncbi:hypothetical protein Q0F98_28235 [Paenibacillus amylolyticus]|nr:hypothetical protein Q0F98_28235 [Paenibacillus amylolyticus]
MQLFGMTVDELYSKKELSPDQEQFLAQYAQRMPVSTAPSVMNRLCHQVEDEFNKLKLKQSESQFDHTILMSTKKYSQARYKEIQRLYQMHNEELRSYMTKLCKSKVKKEERSARWQLFVSLFKEQALEICNNEEDLCNMIVDMCYRNAEKSKQFVWDVSGDQIIRNLLLSNDHIIHYPVRDPEGDIEYAGRTFKMTQMHVKEQRP